MSVVEAKPAFAASCGDVLGTINGVNVMSNGADEDTGNSCGGLTQNTAMTPGGTTVTTGYEWQCVEFVNRYYTMKGWISSHWSGNGSTLKDNVPSGLHFTANGSIKSIVVGDVVTLNYSTFGHAGIVSAVNGNMVTIANQNTGGVNGTATYDPVHQTLSSEYRGFTMQGIIHADANNGGGGTGGSTFGLIGPDSAIYAEANAGSLNWTQEVAPGNATKIAMAGSYQAFLRGDGAVFAKSTFGEGGWTQETSASSASTVAVSNTGILLIIGTDNAVYSMIIDVGGGWYQEVGPGNATAIAVGGNTMMFLRGDDTVFAKVGAGGSWTAETFASAASAIAVGSGGLQVILGLDGSLYTTGGVGWGGWTGQTASSAAIAIAAA